MPFFRRRFARLFLIAGLFSAVGLGAAACHHRFSSPEQKVEFVKKRIAGKLDLTTEQEKILDKLDEPFKAMIQEHDTLRSKHLQSFKDALSAGGAIDASVFLNLYSDRRDALDKHMPSIAATFSELSATLTTQQRKELQDLLEKWEHRFSR